MKRILKLCRNALSLSAALLISFSLCHAFAEEAQQDSTVTSRDSIFPQRQKEGAKASEQQAPSTGNQTASAASEKSSAPAGKSSGQTKSKPAGQSEGKNTAENQANQTKSKGTGEQQASAEKPASQPNEKSTGEAKVGGAEVAFPSRKSSSGASTSEADPSKEGLSADQQEEPPFVPSATDPYSGWGYTRQETAEYRKGHLKAVLRGSQGTFGLYAVRDDGKEIPLLSSYDFFNSSAFMLRVGRKEYLLNYSGGVQSEARRTEAGLQMVYTIPGKATFIVDFTFPEKRVTGGLEDTIKVTMYTVNIGTTPQTFTSKAIFDTILGESSSKHFCTYAEAELNSQRMFHSMKGDRWICSANNAAAIEFLFYGADISEPECVTVGPIGSLSDYWEPVAHEGKGFSTVLSYNNSGVAVNWKTSYLLPEQVDVKTFYIATAEGVEPIYAGRMPSGDELIEALETGNDPFPGSMAGETGTPIPIAVTPPPVKEAEGQKQEAVKSSQKLPAGKDETPQAELSEAAKAVTAEQLDYEYIQNLIDYIESLQDAESIDREELDSLNEELDAIFEKLRSMGN